MFYLLLSLCLVAFPCFPMSKEAASPATAASSTSSPVPRSANSVFLHRCHLLTATKDRNIYYWDLQQMPPSLNYYCATILISRHYGFVREAVMQWRVAQMVRYFIGSSSNFIFLFTYTSSERYFNIAIALYIAARGNFSFFSKSNFSLFIPVSD